MIYARRLLRPVMRHWFVILMRLGKRFLFSSHIRTSIGHGVLRFVFQLLASSYPIIDRMYEMVWRPACRIDCLHSGSILGLATWSNIGRSLAYSLREPGSKLMIFCIHERFRGVPFVLCRSLGRSSTHATLMGLGLT